MPHARPGRRRGAPGRAAAPCRARALSSCAVRDRRCIEVRIVRRHPVDRRRTSRRTSEPQRLGPARSSSRARRAAPLARPPRRHASRPSRAARGQGGEAVAPTDPPGSAIAKRCAGIGVSLHADVTTESIEQRLAGRPGTSGRITCDRFRLGGCRHPAPDAFDHAIGLGRTPAPAFVGRQWRWHVQHGIDDRPRRLDDVLTSEERRIAYHRIAQQSLVGTESCSVALRLARSRPTA